MNLDPVPPVRRLLTHVIPDGLVQREAGISHQSHYQHYEDYIGYIYIIFFADGGVGVGVANFDPFETLTLLKGSEVIERLQRGKCKGLKGNKLYKNP